MSKHSDSVAASRESKTDVAPTPYAHRKNDLVNPQGNVQSVSAVQKRYGEALINKFKDEKISPRGRYVSGDLDLGREEPNMDKACCIQIWNFNS